MRKLLSINNAYFPAFINSGIFFIISLVFFLIQPESRLLLLLPPLIFSIGSFFIFLSLIKSLRVFEPLTWFILGSGIFFGIGVIAGGLNSHEWTRHIFGESYEHLLGVNLLNSSSVLIILTVGILVLGDRSMKTFRQSLNQEKSNIFAQIFPYLLFFSFVAILLRFIFFPYAEDLVIRSVINKISFFIPSIFVIGGYILKDLTRNQFISFIVIFLLQVSLGVLSFNKSDILMPIIALLIGLWANNITYKLLAFSLLFPIIIFWITNPFVTIGRKHDTYVASLISDEIFLSDRVNIFVDIMSIKLSKNSVNSVNSQLSNDLSFQNTHNSEYVFFTRLKGIGVRLDVATIQGWLIREYNNQRPGKSMDDFFSVLIPRVIWPSKPIVTRRGNELNKLYYGQTVSSVAPTYSAEAYWNYGYIGLIGISIYLGLFFGWLSRLVYSSKRGMEPAYFFVTYHAIFSAIFLESWIVSTYVGGIAIIIIFFFMIKFLLLIYQRIWGLKHA